MSNTTAFFELPTVTLAAGSAWRTSDSQVEGYWNSAVPVAPQGAGRLRFDASGPNRPVDRSGGGRTGNTALGDSRVVREALV